MRNLASQVISSTWNCLELILGLVELERRGVRGVEEVLEKAAKGSPELLLIGLVQVEVSFFSPFLLLPSFKVSRRKANTTGNRNHGPRWFFL